MTFSSATGSFLNKAGTEGRKFGMSAGRRILVLVGIMVLVAAVVAGVSILFLYPLGMDQQRERLTDIVKSRARMLEAIARFDALESGDYPGGATAATLSQIREAHEDFPGFARTGEFTLASRQGEEIVFVLRHRHGDLDEPKRVPFAAGRAEPMRRALSGRSGSMVGADYRGVQVLAAYEPVAVLGMGAVVKIDLAEIRAPFVRAGMTAGGIGLIAIFLGVLAFLRVTAPVLRKLEESESGLRSLFERMPSGVAVYEALEGGGDFLFKDFNRAAERIEKLKREEVFGRRLTEIFPGVKQFGLLEVLRRVWETGEPEFFPESFYRDDREPGTWREAWAYRLPSGNVVAVYNDVTERRRAHEALRKSEAKFRLIAESSAEDIWQLDLDGNVTYVSPAVERIFGYTREEAGELGFGAFFFETDLPRAEEAFRRAVSGEPLQLLEFEGRRKDGSSVPIEVSVTPIVQDDEIVGVQGIARDITARKKAEDALRESETRLTFLIDNMVDIIWTMDLDLRTTYVSPSVERVLGFTPEERMRQPLDEILTQDSIDKARRLLSEELSREKSVTGDPDRSINMEVEYHRKDGTTVWCENTMKWLRNAEGEITGIHGVSRDISDRKGAERELRASEERFRQIAENIREVFWLGARDWNEVFYVSPAYQEVWGRSCDSLYDEPLSWLDSVHHEDRAAVVRAIEEKVQGRSVDPDFPEYRVVRPDGSLRWILARSFPVQDETNEIGRIAGIAEDITERKRLEEQFQQAQKIESIGRLAGGVAHDLNNMLSPILGYAELLLEDTDRADPRREAVQEILSAGRRARGLVRQLLAFSRKQTMEFKPIDLNSLLRDFEKLLRRTVREDIAIRMLLAGAVPLIRGDVGQLEQVVMNLAVNAQDAMPEGGDLNIETETVELDQADAASHPDVAPGRYVVLTVRDTGCGMDDEIRKHLFEPFFTTKEKEKGTGLGLSTVFGIVKQHGGNVLAYGEPGRGATFKVYLPVSDGAPVGRERVAGPVGDLEGSETVLLVEDNEQVRRLGMAVLRQKGYEVLVAESGEQAMRILERHGGPVHLLLTDVVMPDMNGKELFERLSASHPDIRVLYMSGYTGDVIARHGVLDPGVQFIQKPFSVNALAAKVWEVLEG